MRSAVRRGWLGAWLATALAVLLLVQLPGGVTYSAFSAAAENTGNQLSSAPDWVAPVAHPVVVAKEHGHLSGSVRPGGKYYVYAQVTDSGNPASGVASATSDVAVLTAGQTATALTSGTFSTGGVTYNRRSSLLTADSGVATGNHAFSVASSDAAANARTQSGLSVVVDGTAASSVDVQARNGAKTAGLIEQGDELTFTYSEQIDPHSVVSGWDGSSMHVVVRVTQGGLLGFLNDSVTIWDAGNTTQLPLGHVDLGRLDYVSSSMTYGEVATPSRMVQSGSTITITLGRLVGGTPNTAGGSGSMSWTPSCSVYDAAGNSCSLAVTAGESGAADVDF